MSGDYFMSQREAESYQPSRYTIIPIAEYSKEDVLKDLRAKRDKLKVGIRTPNLSSDKTINANRLATWQGKKNDLAKIEAEIKELENNS